MTKKMQGEKKASLFCWLILVVVWSRVLCSEVYLVGSENSHICEASFSADLRDVAGGEDPVEGAAVNGDPQGFFFFWEGGRGLGVRGRERLDWLSTRNMTQA